MADPVPAVPAVTDRRTPPRGVLPRGMQTWLIAGIGFGGLAVIALTGRPQPAPQRAEPQAAAPAPPSPDRVKEYQERLRVLDERARQEAASEPQAPSPLRPAHRYQSARGA